MPIIRWQRPIRSNDSQYLSLNRENHVDGGIPLYSARRLSWNCFRSWVFAAGGLRVRLFRTSEKMCSRTLCFRSRKEEKNTNCNNKKTADWKIFSFPRGRHIPAPTGCCQVSRRRNFISRHILTTKFRGVRGRASSIVWRLSPAGTLEDNEQNSVRLRKLK